MSETPILQLPFPVSSGLIADGALNIEQLAETTEGVIVVPSDSGLTGTSAWNLYPVGISMMQVAAGSGWPAGGVVLSIRRQDGTQTHQYYSGTSKANPVAAFRFGDSTGWSAWIAMATTGMIQEAAAATLTTTTVKDGVKSVAVTFPAGRFTNTPRVFCQYAGTSPGACEAAPNERSTSGFTMNIWANASWGASIQWLAVRMNTDLVGDNI